MKNMSDILFKDSLYIKTCVHSVEQDGTGIGGVYGTVVLRPLFSGVS